MKKRNLLSRALVLGALAGCAGANGGSISGGESSGARGGAGGSYSYGSGGAAGGGGAIMINMDAAMGATDAPTLPPEKEQKLDFLAPRAGARYVYVANPARNTVSVIDSTTLGVVELAPGDSPTYVATVPGQDVALVINAGSHSLRILRGIAMNDRPIPIITKANAISISPDGMHAVIWFDASLMTGTSSTSAAAATGSTQEVSVVKLAMTTGNVFSMSVGYNPSAVVFSNDNAAAFVVTDDGISELRFASITAPAIAPFTRFNSATTTPVRTDAGAAVAARVFPPDGSDASPDTTSGGPVIDDGASLDGGAVSLDGGTGAIDTQIRPDATGRPDLGTADTQRDLSPPDAAPADTTPPPIKVSTSTAKPVDVSVTADGSYAIARREGTAELLLVNLKTRVVSAIQMSSTITDLDLLPTGTEAFAVLRGESKLVRIEIPSGFFDESHRHVWPLEVDDPIGSVTMSPKGRYALLYTTTNSAKSLIILDLAKSDSPPPPVVLKMPIRAVAIAPDEKTALVLHTAPSSSGSGGSSGTTDKTYGYTMVHLEDGFSKLQQTAADPYPFAITPSSSHAFVLLRDDKAGVRIAERISLTSFIVDDFQLGSPPTSIAALSEATHKVFVGQVHAEGRISFIDWLTGSVESVTGFALNGRIQQ